MIVRNIKATVAILTKNPGIVFKEVLRSVLSQSTQWEFEVLIIDSGSSDGTLEFVRTHSTVRLVEVPSKEFGHGKTRNLAMSLANGEYVAMITHDAKPANDQWLSNLVSITESDPNICGSFGRHIPYDNASPFVKRDLQLHFDHFLTWPTIMGIEEPERYKLDQGYRQVLHFFSDNNACIKKNVWKKIPYPDVDFAEDQLWAKTAIEAGYKRAYADNAIVYHSHNYNILDTFRRSFDESRALKMLFSYELSGGFWPAWVQTLRCTVRDISYLVISKQIRSNKLLALKTPILNAAKQFGFFIGGRQGVLRKLSFSLFSLDNSKKNQ